MDDKVKVGVGEPHLAIAFGGRGRRSIFPTYVTSIAGNHDFKIISLTPSVTLRVDASPDKGEDRTSCYRGGSLSLFNVFANKRLTFIRMCVYITHRRGKRYG